MMQAVTEKSRVEQLRELLMILAKEIDDGPGARDMASLAKQYRETIKEIEEIEGMSEADDEIGEILAEREADGKPGAIRKTRA